MSRSSSVARGQQREQVVSLRALVGPTPRQDHFIQATRKYRYTLYGGAAGGGKALALDTPIPTPSGWTTMGEIQPGDQVLDERGEPCRVVAVSPIFLGNTVYEVVFDDGSIIRADAGHLWHTHTAADRAAALRRTDAYRSRRRATRGKRGTGKRPDLAEMNRTRSYDLSGPPTGSIRTTADILATLRVGKSGRLNHSVPVTEPLQLPDADLPMDPYVLGAWLGDGHTGGMGFTCADSEIVEQIRAAGYDVVSWPSGQYSYGIHGINKDLRAAGVLGDKHIPAAYLRASERQRWALLSGLMDTDGTALTSGSCEFYTTNRRLADGVAELLASLGIKAAIQTSRAMIRGRDCGEKYRLKFTTTHPVFRLPRKQERQVTQERGTQRWRYISDVRPVPSEPVRCIEVDSPSRLYLAGRSMIPTHNSYILRWNLIALLLEWAAQGHLGVRVGLFCEDYPALRDRHLSRIPFEFPSWLGKLREDVHEFRIAKQFGGGVIAFRNLDDPSKYLSAEFAAIAIDELTLNEQTVFDFLRMRLRWPGIHHTPFMAATNPGGVGHTWVKRLWIDRDFPEELAADAGQFAFIPAKASDNPHLPPSYLQQLDSLPEQMRKAYRDGDWDLFAGQAFPEWRRDIHVCKPFEIPPWWRRWRSNDRGYGTLATWYWLAASPDGQVYVYREWTCTEVAPSDQAREVVRRSVGPDGQPEKIDFTAVPDDVNTKDPERGKSWADLYREGGLNDLFTVRRDPEVRAALVHEYLKPMPHPLDPNRQTARLQVFDTCTYLIRTLPGLPSDPKRPNRVQEGGDDHGFDGLGHGLQAWHANASRAPEPEQPVVASAKQAALKAMRRHRRRI